MTNFGSQLFLDLILKDSVGGPWRPCQPAAVGCRLSHRFGIQIHGNLSHQKTVSNLSTEARNKIEILMHTAFQSIVDSSPGKELLRPDEADSPDKNLLDANIDRCRNSFVSKFEI